MSFQTKFRIWVFLARIISICEASCKIKKYLHLGQKNALFGYFRVRIRKSHCHIWNQRPHICLIANLVQNKKSLNLGPKIPNLSIFDQKCLIWVFLGHNFKKNYCHIWNQHSWLCLIAKYREMIKMPKFGTKSAIFGYFWARILKTYCHIWNQQPEICLFAKFHEKMPKFGTPNTWFGYLWPKMPYLDTFELQFKKNNCHIWISNPWIHLIEKYWEIMKMPKFGTTSALFEYFRARILKNCCHNWNQHPRTSAIAKFCEETKMPKLGTKSSFIGYFWPEMLVCVFLGKN